MQHVVVVEPNALAGGALAASLESEGFQVTRVSDLAAAIAAFANRPPDLVILDFSGGQTTALDQLKKVRAAQANVPVVILSASSDEAERVAAFRLGADDYLTIPVSLLELIERIKLRLRHAHLDASSALRSGPLVLQPRRRTVFVDRYQLHLAPKEFDLLYALMRARGEVRSHEQLLAEVWNIRARIDTRRIQFHIKQLRRKLKPYGMDTHLITVSRRGYAWRAPES